MFNFLPKKISWFHILWPIIASSIVFTFIIYILPQSKELLNKIWLRKFELISAASGLATVLLLGWTIWDARTKSQIDHQRFLFETDPHVIVDLDNSKGKHYINIKNVGRGAVCDVLVSVMDKFDSLKEICLYGFFHPGNSFITDISLEEIREILKDSKVPDSFKINIQYTSFYNKNKTQYSQNFVVIINTETQSPNIFLVELVTPTMRTPNKKL